MIKDIVPLTDLNDIVFGGWDIFPDNAYEAAMYAEVLKEKDLNVVMGVISDPIKNVYRIENRKDEEEN